MEDERPGGARRPAPGSSAAGGPDEDRPGAALLLILGFASLVPLAEASAKALGEAGMGAVQIGLTRFALQVVAVGLLLLALGGGRPWRRPRPLWPFVARGGCVAAGVCMLYAGLAVMPLANATALFMTQPLVVTLLAGLALGEPVGWRRRAGVAVGFAGALLIAGPEAREIGPAALLPLLAAVAFAGSSLLTRAYARHAGALDFLFVTAATGAAVLGAATAAGAALGIPALAPVAPSRLDWALLAALASVNMATHLMAIQAFRIAPASVVAPFLYLELAGATVVGFLVFGDLPGPATIAGAALIVGAGLFVWWRERVRRAPVGELAPRR